MAKANLAEITLPGLAMLDNGELALWFEMEVQRVRRDIQMRPSHTGKRKIKFELVIEPIPDDHGVFSAFVTAECTSVLPKMRSSATKVKFSEHNKGMVFQPEFPDNPDQLPMFPQDHATS